jgi:hypothetical protein
LPGGRASSTLIAMTFGMLDPGVLQTGAAAMPEQGGTHGH